MYEALGRNAYDKFGDKAVAKDIAPYLAAALAQSATLLAEIEKPKDLPIEQPASTAPALQGSFRRRYLLVGVGVIGLSSLLIAVVPRMISFARLKTVKAGEGKNSGGREASIAGKQTEAVRPARSSGGSEGYSGSIDPAVKAILGPVSSVYTRNGLDDIELGQSFEKISSTRELETDFKRWRFFVRGKPHGDWFAFDDKHKLVIYHKQYEGGADQNVNEVKRRFGPTASPVLTRIIQNPTAASSFTYAVYTFPKTVVIACFYVSRRAQGGRIIDEEGTSLTIMDREWAVSYLQRSAKLKRSLVEWFRKVVELLSAGKRDLKMFPPPEGLQLYGDPEDDGRFFAMLREPDAEKKGNLTGYTLGTIDMRHGYARTWINPNNHTVLTGNVLLLKEAKEAPTTCSEDLATVSFLAVLDNELTVHFAQEAFPSNNGEYSYKPMENGNGWYIWLCTAGARGPLTVGVGGDGMIECLWETRSGTR